MRQWFGLLLAVTGIHHIRCKLATEETTGLSVEADEPEQTDLGRDESGEHILGAAITLITKHPYAAAIINNNTYICSAIILNTYWLITESKCFDSADGSSYVTHKKLSNFTVRVGSSYNNKGGSLYKITTLINNFDVQVSALKLHSPLEFSSRVRSVRMPEYDEDATLGHLASMIAWTPNGHMRVVNAPVIDSSICDPFTKLPSGYFICVGGVQDPNRHFCRKDNGGAVIQNNTLIGVSSFIHSCALYSRAHAFPKVSTFARWLDSLIWDETNRPTISPPTSDKATTKHTQNTTNDPKIDDRSPYYNDQGKFMLTLPFDPINVPLEPAEDNSVIPRMSLYESYLKSLARARTSTTLDPLKMEEQKRRMETEYMKKYGSSVMKMSQSLVKRNNNYDFNKR